MLCYKDKTFCNNEMCINHKCSIKITKQLEIDADKFGLPIAYSDFGKSCKEYKSLEDLRGKNK